MQGESSGPRALPDLSHLSGVEAEYVTARDGRRVLAVSTASETSELRQAHTLMLAAGWRMHSGSAQQGGTETRRYTPTADGEPGGGQTEPTGPRPDRLQPRML